MARLDTIAAYDLTTTYNFMVLAVNRFGQEKVVAVSSNSPMFCNVCEAFRALPEAKGWTIAESWEVA